MATAFYGLHIAKTGLYASQKGLEIVGNNIANVNTEGYTRQQLNVSSLKPPGASGTLLGIEKAMVGAGVRVESIKQCRDKYLDIQYRQGNSDMGEWQIKADSLFTVEDVFNDTSNAELEDVLGLFFSSLEELSKSPEGAEIRTLVRQHAIVLTETMNNYSNRLERLQNELNDNISVVVGQINSLITSIHDFNNQILKYERNGDNANELRDKRNTALDNLSNLIGISYSENSAGVVTVTIGENNVCVVDESGEHSLSAEKIMPDYFGNSDSFYAVLLPTGAVAQISDIGGGALKGYFDMRDGDNLANIGVPYFIKKLDDLTAAIVETVNEVHNQGYTYPSSENGEISKNGVDFFNPENISAKTMSLSNELIESIFNIAASSVEITGDFHKGNGQNALKMLDILEKEDIAVISNIHQHLKSIISDIAVQTSYSNGRVDNENILLSSISYKKSCVSGVSTDEEITNMVMFQKAYSASARLITAIDEQLDTLINRMGIVGR
ncbi:MAG: flagellar hook-associated protein FlgK [Firmicutes bacterium]|nr:flagellar hook-associated protein FlgK [Bacillota bacterium]